MARKAGDPVFEVGAVLGRMNAARDALGLDRDFAVDFHGRVPVANAARLLPQLEPFHLLFAEEPVLPEHLGAIDRLIGPVPLATGNGSSPV